MGGETRNIPLLDLRSALPCLKEVLEEPSCGLEFHPRPESAPLPAQTEHKQLYSSKETNQCMRTDLQFSIQM